MSHNSQQRQRKSDLGRMTTQLTIVVLYNTIQQWRRAWLMSYPLDTIQYRGVPAFKHRETNIFPKK